MAAVAVRERMDLYQSVMKAHRDLVGRIGLVFDPGLRVVKQLPQRRGDFIERYPEITFASPELTGPPPYVTEHLLVQIHNKFLAQQITPTSERPVLRARD